MNVFHVLQWGTLYQLTIGKKYIQNGSVSTQLGGKDSFTTNVLFKNLDISYPKFEYDNVNTEFPSQHHSDCV